MVKGEDGLIVCNAASAVLSGREREVCFEDGGVGTAGVSICSFGSLLRMLFLFT